MYLLDVDMERRPMKNDMKSPIQQSREQTLITEKLKIFYNSVQEEAIPDRFIQMLEQLEKAEQAEKASSKNPDQENESDG